MSHITGILCRMYTAADDGAGTDGWVYLGIGGREFCLDTTEDDYEAGSVRTYQLGEIPGGFSYLSPKAVRNPGFNDPRKNYGLDSSFLSQSPTYIRFEPHGDSANWKIRYAMVIVFVDNQVGYLYEPPAPFDGTWLGDPAGKILYLLTWQTLAGANAIRCQVSARSPRSLWWMLSSRIVDVAAEQHGASNRALAISSMTSRVLSSHGENIGCGPNTVPGCRPMVSLFILGDADPGEPSTPGEIPDGSDNGLARPVRTLQRRLERCMCGAFALTASCLGTYPGYLGQSWPAVSTAGVRYRW